MSRDKVTIREVGPRDGLQMVKEILTTDQKLEWIRKGFEAGLPDIEVTSFVPPQVVPQFADAAEVAARAVGLGLGTVAVLVPNQKGAERAFAAGVPVVNYVLSASEAHNQANVRRTTTESLDGFAAIAALRDGHHGPRVHLGGCIATAFGCTIQGEVSENLVVDIARRYAEMGADEIIVADTVGYGNPAQVRRIMSAVVAAVSPLPVACHFHDTRGLGLANVMAALEAGVFAFDASLGGLGGCPFAPGASGNIDTEDTVYLLESMGLETGVQLDALAELRGLVQSWLTGQHMGGAIARAGLPKTMTGGRPGA